MILTDSNMLNNSKKGYAGLLFHSAAIGYAPIFKLIFIVSTMVCSVLTAILVRFGITIGTMLMFYNFVSS